VAERTRVAALALAIFVHGAGCASVDATGSGWARPSAGVQEVTLDAIWCARAAEDAGHTPDLILGGVVDVARLVVENAQARRAYERCMSGRGYRVSFAF